jgi:hypothetical protein
MRRLAAAPLKHGSERATNRPEQTLRRFDPPRYRTTRLFEPHVSNSTHACEPTPQVCEYRSALGLRAYLPPVLFPHEIRTRRIKSPGFPRNHNHRCKKQRGMKPFKLHPPRYHQNGVVCRDHPGTRFSRSIRSYDARPTNPAAGHSLRQVRTEKRFLLGRAGGRARATGRLSSRFAATSDAEAHQQRDQSKLLHNKLPFALSTLRLYTPDRSILLAEAVIHDPGKPGIIPTGIQIFYDTERIYQRSPCGMGVSLPVLAPRAKRGEANPLRILAAPIGLYELGRLFRRPSKALLSRE